MQGEAGPGAVFGEDRRPWATSERIPFTAENSSWPLPVKACEAASPDPARKLTTNAPRGHQRRQGNGPGDSQARGGRARFQIGLDNKKPQAIDLGFPSGAGDENRTRALSLGS
ncbi:protein of unknown function [Streptomyces murinus]